MSYSKLVTIKGTVNEFTWANPHPMMTLDVRTDGRVEKWLVGGPALNRMEANGWSRDTVKVGDVITGVGYLSFARTPSPCARPPTAVADASSADAVRSAITVNR